MLKPLLKWSYFVCALLYVALPAYLIFHVLGEPLTGTDDSNIYLQYTRNFSSGYGIVYNPGGEHVEGFSSTLYFLICSLFNCFTDSPEILILVFNLVLALVSCMMMLHIITRICRHLNIPELNIHLLWAAYLFWMVINPSFFCWTIVTLMDSGIYTFLLILAFSFFVTIALEGEQGEKQLRNSMLLMFLIIIGRPEGLVWAAVYLFLYFILVNREKQNPGRSFRAIIPLMVVWIGTLALMTCYRLWYFGYPLPNTYYTKISASLSSTLHDGFEYFSGFLAMYKGIVLLFSVLLAFWLIYSFYKKQRTPLFFVSFITLVFIFTGLALPVLEGGDHFHAFRFFQPVYPFLIIPFILLLLLLRHAFSFSKLLLRVVVVALLLFYCSNADWDNFYRNNNTFQAPEDVSLCIKIEFNIAAYTRENGKRLNDFFKGELPVIGFGAAGGIALGYDGIVYDMLGLNLTKMAHADKIKKGPKAHQSFNKKVFYELKPDVLMPTAEHSNVPVSLVSVNAYYCDPGSWDNLIYKNIFNDPEFRQQYTLALARNAAQPDYVCYGFFNKDYLKKLSQNPNFKIQMLN